MIRAPVAALATPYPHSGEEPGGWADTRTSVSELDTRSSTARTRLSRRGRPRGMEPVLGRYRLCGRLGAGGFGTVWLAWDERLEREVALKLLPRELIATGRFEREARAAARLNHPAIVLLYEAAVDDEGGYLVSELVHGQTLEGRLQEGRLSDRDIVRAALCLCDALEYAHGQGVVHRDVKPSNILMPDAPSTLAGMAKLNDFGVARLVGSDQLTRTGDVVGTTAYMAPEQAEGREAGASADLYSLALVVYEALTGVNPVRLDGGSGRSARRLGTYLPAIRRRRPDLPSELACAIDLALRPRQRDRGTVADLREALQSAFPRMDDSSPVPATGRALRRSVAPSTTTRSWLDQTARRPGETSSPAGLASSLARLDLARASARATWLDRLLAGAAAAAATAWFATSVLSPSPVLPALAVLLTALAAVLFPGVSWLVLVAAGLGLLIEQGGAGGAIVLLVGALPVLLLLLRQRPRWGLAASVPALAAVGLGGLWPALAGRASTGWERMVLGAGGWLWLVVGGFLAGHSGYLRLPPGSPSPRVWTASLDTTVHQVLNPLLYSGILAPALVWAGGALVLPWIAPRPVRAGDPRAWIACGCLLLAWAGIIAGVSEALLVTLAPGVRIPPGQAVGGAFACALGAGVRWPGAGRRSVASSDSTPGLA